MKCKSLCSCERVHVQATMLNIHGDLRLQGGKMEGRKMKRRRNPEQKMQHVTITLQEFLKQKLYYRYQNKLRELYGLICVNDVSTDASAPCISVSAAAMTTKNITQDIQEMTILHEKFTKQIPEKWLC